MNDDDLKKKAADLMAGHAQHQQQEANARSAFAENMQRLHARVPVLLDAWEAALKKCAEAMNDAARAQGLHSKFGLIVARPKGGSGGVMGFSFGDYEFYLTYGTGGSVFGHEAYTAFSSHATLHGGDITDKVNARYLFTPELHEGKAVLAESKGDKSSIVDPSEFWMTEAEKALKRSR
jgi:hypothetical protein